VREKEGRKNIQRSALKVGARVWWKARGARGGGVGTWIYGGGWNVRVKINLGAAVTRKVPALGQKKNLKKEKKRNTSEPEQEKRNFCIIGKLILFLSVL